VTQGITARSTSTSTRLRQGPLPPKAGLFFPDRTLLIAAQSCQKYEGRRIACRETWIPEARNVGFDVLFYVGSDHPPCCGKPWPEGQIGDVLTVGAKDDYESLVSKSAALFRWASRNRPNTWIFRCDDDTLVRPDLLKEFLHTAEGDYHGFAMTHESKPEPYASGGGGMLLSPRAVQLMAGGLTHDTSLEDVEIGRTLTMHGISFTHCDRFRPFCNTDPGDNNEPLPSNDYITGHMKTPKPGTCEGGIQLMRRLWARLRVSSRMPPDAAAERADRIPGWMFLDELQWIAEQASTCERWADLGVHKGRSLTAAGLVCRGEVVGVDTDTLPEVGHIGVENPEATVKLLNMGTVEAAAEFPNRHFCGVFLDAGHEFEQVTADLHAWRAKVKRGGIICGHDYGKSDLPGVGRAVDAFFAKGLGVVQRGPGSIWFVRV
jgi:hypothetical protein